jgi:hypothetical protein
MKASPHSRLRKYRNLLCLAVKPFYRRFVLGNPARAWLIPPRIGAVFEHGETDDHFNRQLAV